MSWSWLMLFDKNPPSLNALKAEVLGLGFSFGCGSLSSFIPAKYYLQRSLEGPENLRKGERGLRMSNPSFKPVNIIKQSEVRQPHHLMRRVLCSPPAPFRFCSSEMGVSFWPLMTSKFGFVRQKNVAAEVVRFIESKIAPDKRVVLLLVPFSWETGMTMTTDLTCSGKRKTCFCWAFLL